MTNQLPEALSDVIIAATDDAIACEESPEYRLNMNVWHSNRNLAMFTGRDLGPQVDGLCHVCLGGSVLAQRFGITPAYTVHLPANLPGVSQHDFDRIHALDHIREGNINDALGEMFPEWGVNDALPDRKMPCYESEFPQFVEALKSIASELREAGL